MCGLKVVMEKGEGLGRCLVFPLYQIFSSKMSHKRELLLLRLSVKGKWGQARGCFLFPPCFRAFRFVTENLTVSHPQ